MTHPLELYAISSLCVQIVTAKSREKKEKKEQWGAEQPSYTNNR